MSLNEKNISAYLAAIGLPALLCREARILHANPAAETLGYGQQTLQTMTLHDLLDERSHTLIAPITTHHLGGPPLRWQVRRADGALLEVHASAQPAPFAGEGCYLVLCVPIPGTDSAHAEDAPDADDLPVGVYRVDSAGRINYVNAALMQLLGATDPAELVGRSSLDFYAEPELARVWINDLAQTRGLITQDVELRRIDDTPIFVRDIWRGHYDAAGRLIYADGILQDISAERELAQQLQIVADNSPDLIIIFDTTQNRTLYSNRPDMLGHPVETLNTLAANLAQIHPEDRDTCQAQWAALAAGNQPPRLLEYRMMSASRTWEWVQNRQVVLARDEAGRPQQILFVISIITERKRNEEALAQRNAQLEALYQISSALVSTLDLHTIMHRFLSHLRDVVPLDSAHITLLTASEPRFMASIGLTHPDLVESINRTMSLTPFMRSIVEAHAPVIKSDVQQDPDWVLIPGTEHIRGWMGIPMFYQGEIIGLLTLDKSEPDFYTQEHARQALTVAQQAAVMIMNAELFQRAQEEIAERRSAQDRLLATLEHTSALYQVANWLIASNRLEEMLPRVLDLVAQTLGAHQSLLISMEPNQRAPLHQIQHGLMDQASGWALYQAILELAPNHGDGRRSDREWPAGMRQTLPDGRHLVAAPLRYQGLLALLRPPEQAPFSSEDQELVAALAGQVTIATENEVLYQQVRDEAQRLEDLVDQRTHQLHLERLRLQAILDATGEGIFYIENFTFQYANPAFCRMLGYSPYELVGRPLSIIRSPVRPDQEDLPASDPFEQILGEGDAWQIDVTWLRRRDDSTFPAALNFTLLGEPGVEPKRLVAVVRDVSREQALQAQRVRFLTNAAHELRTPLTSFGLRLHMLRRQPERSAEHLESLERAAQYLKQIVEQLLDLSRFENDTLRLQWEMRGLQALIMDALRAHEPDAQMRDVVLSSRLPSEEIRAAVDPTRFTQMLDGLLTNAIAYSPAGSPVLVTLRLEEHGGLPMALIEVSDRGRGVEAHLLPDQIFEPFSRPRLGNQQETGMGLAIARQIARLHSGSISAQVDEMHGINSITVRIPVRAALHSSSTE